MLYISLAGETIAHIGVFSITNSLLTTWVIMGVIIISVIPLQRTLSLVPTRGQVFLEFIVGSLYTMFEGVLGQNVKRFFPLLATFFIFIILSNWFGLLPGVGSIGFHERLLGEEKFVPLLRAPTADLNTTFALALISFVVIQTYGMKALGSATYLSKFINFTNPINFYVGLLELISELGKIVSFAFRLFGNIFAGEVLLSVIAFLIPVIAPLPFIGLELFVGFIQALVFSMLTAVFIASAAVQGEH
ncbi:F0F1 ATP synthase subunit A [Candidatus Roizmanbacteria bacterium]|nr:F0F1 ATP synthase subunit A [Candidatus Roizmanbacteria bacterium]